MRTFTFNTSYAAVLLTLPKLACSGEITGKIISCSGWALNRLPELKKFVKDEGEADSYGGVEIDFKHGREAKLFVYDDGAEIEEIKLSELSTTEEMHALMLQKGFVRSFPGVQLAEVSVADIMEDYNAADLPVD